MSEKVKLDEKTTLIIVVLILCLVFSLGFLTSKKEGGKDVTIFTEDDLNRITQLKEMEEDGSEAEIFAYKDEDGNLMIGWVYDDGGWKND